MAVRAGVCPADPNGGPHVADTDQPLAQPKGKAMYHCSNCLRLFGA